MKSTSETLVSNEFLSIVSTIAVEMGVNAYFVGGGLRDMLMDREIKDLDFALDSQPEKFPETFARMIEGTFFWLNEERLQSRVVKKSNKKIMTFDFAPLRGSDIANDLSLRDFTINAFALPLSEEDSSIIDPLNGIQDLNRCLIKVCSDYSFDEDPLRLLRAIRFATLPTFSIEPGTWRKIREKAPLLKNVSPERIRAELFQILDAKNVGESLSKLSESGLLAEIIPFLYVPREDVSADIRRRIISVIEVEETMSASDFYFSDSADHMCNYLGQEVESGVTMGALVKLAVFLGGTETDVKFARAAAEKLRLGCKARRGLEMLCVKAGHLPSLPAWKPTERAIFRFFRDSEPAGPGALVIALAQNRLPGELCADMASYYFTDYPNTEDIPLLSGEDIMAILGTGPGRPVGEAMKLLRDAEGEGIVNNKAEALAYLGKNLLTKDGAVI